MKKLLLTLAILAAPQLAVAQNVVCIEAFTICDSETGKFFSSYSGTPADYCEAIQHIRCQNLLQSYTEEQLQDSETECSVQLFSLSSMAQKASNNARKARKKLRRLKAKAKKKSCS